LNSNLYISRRVGIFAFRFLAGFAADTIGASNNRKEFSNVEDLR